MSFDSSEIINPDYGQYVITMGGTGNRRTLQNGVETEIGGAGDVSYILMVSDGPWESGDEVGTTYEARNEPIAPDDKHIQISHARKLGKFPIGCITDGQGFAYEADFYEEFDPYTPAGSGTFSDTIGDRVGNIAFLPNASFKNGNPGLKGFLPRADEWANGKDGLGFGMSFLIFINSEMVNYSDCLFAFVGPPLHNAPLPGSPRTGPNVDIRPQRGHILRIVPHRFRLTFD